MQEYTIKGEKKLCYVVKKGDVNDIVITVESLQKVDRRRIEEMESQGGELMRVMRDTVADNGTNALALYKDLLKVVPNPRIKKEPVGESEQSQETESTSTATPTRKKRGRPPGKKKKQ